MTLAFAMSDDLWTFLVVQISAAILAYLKYRHDQKAIRADAKINLAETLANRDYTKEVGEKVKEVEIKVDGRVSEILRLARENAIKDVEIARAAGIVFGTQAEILRNAQSRTTGETGARGATGATGEQGIQGEPGHST